MNATLTLTPTIPSTTLLAMGVKQTSYGKGMTVGDLSKAPGLDELIAACERVENELDAEDLTFSPSSLTFRFEEPGKRHVGAQLVSDGFGEPLLWSRNAYAQLTRLVCPARGGAFLQELSEQVVTNKGGETRPANGLATMALATFLQKETKPVQFRTVRAPDGQRMVRAVVSNGYAGYDDSAFLKALSRGLGKRSANLRVISAQVTSEATRFRLVNLDRGTEIDPTIYYPVITGWNSNVGRRAVYLEDGSFRWACLNGMGSWDARFKYRWNHTGSENRISRAVKSAIDEIGARSSGVVNAYKEALGTGIDDAWDWFEDNAHAAGIHKREIAEVADFVNDPTVSRQGRRPKLLASVVDWTTLAAHQLYPDDLLEQERLETAGRNLLRKGLKERDGQGKLYAKPREEQAAAQARRRR